MKEYYIEKPLSEISGSRNVKNYSGFQKPEMVEYKSRGIQYYSKFLHNYFKEKENWDRI